MGVIISAISGGEVVAAGLDADDVMEIEVDGVSRFVKLSSLVAALQTIDPITGADLDPLTVHEPFVVQDADDNTVVAIVDDPGLGPVFSVDGTADLADKVVIRANGALVELYNNTPELLSYLYPVGLVIGDQTAAIVPDDFVTNIAAYVGVDSGAGIVHLADPAAVTRIDVSLANDALVWVHADGSGVDWDAASVILSADHSDNSGNSLLLAADQISLRDGFGSPIIQALGAGTLAVFAATPYGQDAYIDPTTITPEQLGLAQIARGWMAAV